MVGCLSVLTALTGGVNLFGERPGFFTYEDTALVESGI